jgi:L-seryl-tRNA(Ser) seleniumtransferase
VDAPYRLLPAVEALANDPRLAALPRALAISACRAEIAAARARIAEGATRVDDLVPAVAERVALLADGRLRKVINATGVVVHTNLGRSPWSARAIAAATAMAEGYCNLEIDLGAGRRGGRMEGVTAQLSHLVGAQAALVVNNCAAAVLLALTALARGREVVVSRGELVEIGGAFRVPEVVASGGAKLVEVGTTNRTRVADFEAATTPDTAVWLRVHPSNFRLTGFVESPDRAAQAAAARQRGVWLVEDLGSGSLEDFRGEPGVRAILAAGVDLAMFSGDKLLGGPQAGVIVGRADLVERLRKHPLYRALRVDKVILAGLEATLGGWASGDLPPAARAIQAPREALAARADRLAAALHARGVVSGGDRLADRLRVGRPAVVGRVAEGDLVLDVRTVADPEIDALAAAVAAAHA